MDNIIFDIKITIRIFLNCFFLFLKFQKKEKQNHQLQPLIIRQNTGNVCAI